MGRGILVWIPVSTFLGTCAKVFWTNKVVCSQWQQHKSFGSVYVPRKFAQSKKTESTIYLRFYRHTICATNVWKNWKRLHSNLETRCVADFVLPKIHFEHKLIILNFVTRRVYSAVWFTQDLATWVNPLLAELTDIKPKKKSTAILYTSKNLVDLTDWKCKMQF